VVSRTTSTHDFIYPGDAVLDDLFAIGTFLSSYPLYWTSYLTIILATFFRCYNAFRG